MFQYNLTLFCKYKKFFDKDYKNARWMQFLKKIRYFVNLTGIFVIFINKSFTFLIINDLYWKNVWIIQELETANGVATGKVKKSRKIGRFQC